MTTARRQPTKRRVRPRSARYPATLLVLFLLIAVALGVAPLHRGDWLLENALAAAAVLVLVVTWRRFPLSNLSYSMLFVFLVLHEIGAHYTYSEVPYDDWFRAVFGTSPNDLFGLERNHYDRLVHFAYGLLVAYLGTQGDPWDAHKDMLLATCGAALTMLVTALIHRSLDRDFQREWAESLAVKHPEPLGEVLIDRLRGEAS